MLRKHSNLSCEPSIEIHAGRIQNALVQIVFAFDLHNGYNEIILSSVTFKERFLCLVVGC